MRARILMIFLMVPAALALGSCTTTRTVDRVAADTQIDLSGRWNDSDSRSVAQAMIEDVMRRPWLKEFQSEQDRRPVIMIGTIRNRSTEHIDALTFTKDIERELINSGTVRFVASKQERDEVREERMDQQMESDPATIKRLGKEVGADFFLQGVINSQTDAVAGKKVVLYTVDLELVNIETNEKVWIGSKQIKKYIEQSKFRF